MANLTKTARRAPGDKNKLPTGYHRTQAQPRKAPPGTSPAAWPAPWAKPAWFPLMSLCPSPTAKKPRGKDERETNPLSPATSPATKKLREESLASRNPPTPVAGMGNLEPRTPKDGAGWVAQEKAPRRSTRASPAATAGPSPGAGRPATGKTGSPATQVRRQTFWPSDERTQHCGRQRRPLAERRGKRLPEDSPRPHRPQLRTHAGRWTDQPPARPGRGPGQSRRTTTRQPRSRKRPGKHPPPAQHTAGRLREPQRIDSKRARASDGLLCVCVRAPATGPLPASLRAHNVSGGGFPGLAPGNHQALPAPGGQPGLSVRLKLRGSCSTWNRDYFRVQ